MTSTEAEANFIPAQPSGPAARVRDTAARVREDHAARKALATDTVIRLIRPRWVVVLGVTAATQRKADHWQAAANAALAAVLLLVTGLITRGLLGTTVLMVAVTYAATGGVMKLIRIQLARPFAGDEEDEA